jgi:hypothetical protein
MQCWPSWPSWPACPHSRRVSTDSNPAACRVFLWAVFWPPGYLCKICITWPGRSLAEPGRSAPGPFALVVLAVSHALARDPRLAGRAQLAAWPAPWWCSAPGPSCSIRGPAGRPGGARRLVQVRAGPPAGARSRPPPGPRSGPSWAPWWCSVPGAWAAGRRSLVLDPRPAGLVPLPAVPPAGAPWCAPGALPGASWAPGRPGPRAARLDAWSGAAWAEGRGPRGLPRK